MMVMNTVHGGMYTAEHRRAQITTVVGWGWMTVNRGQLAGKGGLERQG